MSSITETETSATPAGTRGGSDGNGDAPVRTRRWRGRPPVPKLERTRLPYALIAPAVIFMIIVHLLPIGGGVVLSLKELTSFTFRQLFSAPWNGLENFDTILFGDSTLRSGFGAAVRNTIVYTFWTVGLTVTGGLGIALLVNRKMRGQRGVRTLLLVPWVIPTFVVASLWNYMWQSDIGVVNKILVDYVGLVDDRPIWLTGPNSLWALIIPSVWRGLPLAMLLFLAGLQAIPRELTEAAAIDGAGPWRQFRSVVLPLLRPLVAVQLLFGVIYTAYQFAMPNIMMGTNPGRHADLLMTFVVQRSFSNNLVGIGAAASLLITAGMLIWVAIWYAAFRRDLEAVT